MRLQQIGTHEGADEIFMTFAPGGQNEHSNEGEHDVVSPHAGPDTYEDPLDDVFGSGPSSPQPRLQQTDHDNPPEPSGPSELPGSLSRQPQDPSDIPRLRSVHVTNGYREGLSASKEQHVQAGFDEGYSLGAELGMKVGWLMGVLEGVSKALPATSGADVRRGKERGAGGEGLSRESVRLQLRQAEEEMSMRRLFGEEFFGGDGVWIYHVPGVERQGEENVTFKEIAKAHPLVVKWEGRVRGLSERAGLNIREEK